MSSSGLELTVTNPMTAGSTTVVSPRAGRVTAMSLMAPAAAGAVPTLATSAIATTLSIPGVDHAAIERIKLRELDPIHPRSIQEDRRLVSNLLILGIGFSLLTAFLTSIVIGATPEDSDGAHIAEAVAGGLITLQATLIPCLLNSPYWRIKAAVFRAFEEKKTAEYGKALTDYYLYFGKNQILDLLRFVLMAKDRITRDYYFSVEDLKPIFAIFKDLASDHYFKAESIAEMSTIYGEAAAVYYNKFSFLCISKEYFDDERLGKYPGRNLESLVKEVSKERLTLACRAFFSSDVSPFDVRDHLFRVPGEMSGLVSTQWLREHQRMGANRGLLEKLQISAFHALSSGSTTLEPRGAMAPLAGYSSAGSMA